MSLISVGTLGGTIAMVEGGSGGGVVPTLTADALIAAVPQIRNYAQIKAQSLFQLPSPSLKFRHGLEVIAWAENEVKSGAEGIVLTQGTDTLEEMAFLLDLLWEHPQPLVLTGAMRSPRAPGADGPANLVAAVLTAASRLSRERGVLVAMNDTIHAARWITKSHALSVQTFVSSDSGPLGYVYEETPVYINTLSRLPKIDRTQFNADVKIGFYESLLDGDAQMLQSMFESGRYDGIVIAGFGAGHVSGDEADIIERYASRIPVVVASRTYGGRTATKTYGFHGSEIDLQTKGAMLAGWLSPRKARLLLWALLAAGKNLEETRADFLLYNP
ncbi:asparaginase [Brucella sp. BO2]|uniref:asparaginase n=1 Tax=Brucella sp. BO2 TaxID=693750 RepID=UPI00046D92A2|nr:asparaginase [Brucella sp. BO2]QPN27812.1 asparaginase [Brucella sp. BO2]